MSDIQPILQWVALANSKYSEETMQIILHQFDGDKQRNIKEMLDLSETDELDVLIGIPVGQRIGEPEEKVGNPFIAVDMRTGKFNVNGTNWNFFPSDIDITTIKFRPIWFHSIKKDFSISGQSLELKGEKITLYKIGWQFTHKEKNYQRIIFYNVETGEFTLKEKR